MVFLLYLLTNTSSEIKRLVEIPGGYSGTLLIMSLWGFLFGVLIEWQALIKIIKGNLKITWLLIPASALTCISFIPRVYWVEWFGLGSFYVEMLTSAEIQLLLNVLSGILIMRSLCEKS